MCHNKQQAEMLAFGQHYKKKKKVNFQAEFPISEMCFDGFFVPRYILHIQTPLKQHDSCSLKNCIYSQNGHRFSLTHFQTWTHDYLFLPPKQRKHNRRYPDIRLQSNGLNEFSSCIPCLRDYVPVNIWIVESRRRKKKTTNRHRHRLCFDFHSSVRTKKNK